MTWDKDTPTVRCLNEQVESLPECPVCGGWTDLCQVTVPAAAGDLVSFVLLCGSIRALQGGLLRERPPCTFTLPMQRLEDLA